MNHDQDQDLLLWVDLETTGSDVDKDCIVEIGAILTGQDLAPLGEFTQVITPEPEGYGRMMLNPVVRQMHTANGLLDEIRRMPEPVRIHEACHDVLVWLKYLDAQEKRIVLAGSGVGHFDRKFIDRYMPQLSRFLRYWCVDIGVVRRAHRMWVGTEVSRANDNKTHRAIDDIRCHLAEAQAFRALWQSTQAVQA